jgi:KDO2-lipid IV(A) lauroyltransferase
MKAKVIPVFTMRLTKCNSDKRTGYLLRLLPPLENFPTDNDYHDIVRLNQLIEEQIKAFPAQYLWTHKRYKHYASESKDFYKDYLLNNETNCS